VSQENIIYSELTEYKEAFLVSTTRNVVPVVQIDSTKIGDGKPGYMTRQIITILENYVNSY
jgi:branched-subunit amino acid aminotransferase/4-amino-4-deoxychorismate lyase